MKTMTCKTRFAPSPTGYLHLGNVRTALFNALLARREQGSFLLRVEDTDRDRSRPEYVAALLEDLRWLGLDWQEGPEIGGPHPPYAQSERAAIYADYYRRLEERELVYPCFCSPAELALSRKTQLAAGRPPRYAGTCARLSDAERQARCERGLQPTLRFRTPPGQQVQFTDLARGPQQFASDDIGDFIIRRADGGPQFFFANAVDDALMGITHLLRGEDHLSNTPRQLLLLEALDLPAPRYGHLALIVGADGGPLSKREGHFSVRELRAAGYLPEALLNYLARVGHSYERDHWMPLAELAGEFTLERLGRAAARYDEAQLRHWQSEAVQRADPERLWVWLESAVADQVPTTCREAFIAAVRPNIRFPADAAFWAERLFGAELPLSEESRVLIAQTGSEFFAHALAAYAEHGGIYQPLFDDLKHRTGAKGKALFMPMRAALTGELHGPELARILALMPAELARRRLESAGSGKAHSPMHTVLALRHVAFEDLDGFAPLLAERGYALRYVDAGYDDLTTLDPLTDDLWIVLGGPIGVYEQDAYPFLRDELRLLRARLTAGRPTLGICLGCQLIAQALGGRVYPGHGKEIGWKPLTLTAAGLNSPLAAFADGTPVLHWHGDTFDLPDNAVLLASTDQYLHQAFSWGNHALALQFHIETTGRGLERWLIGHAGEIAATPGLTVPALRAATAVYAGNAAKRGRQTLIAWLEQAGL